MAPPRKHLTQATAAAPAAPKGKGKTVEAPKSADRRPNLSDIHIIDAEDSHSNLASPRGMQAAEPEPQHTSKQLLQMFFTLRKQMEDQQTKMIRLREAAAREKTLQVVSRHDYSNKLGYDGSRNLPLLWKEMSGFPHHYRAPRNLHTPPEARGATGRGPMIMMRIPGIQSVPRPRSSLA